MIRFKANFFRMNKGPNNQPAYFSTIRNNVVKNLNLSLGEGLLLRTGSNVFPTVLRKHGSNRVSYGFTVPYKIANTLHQKNPEFALLTKDIKNVDKICRKNELNLLRIIPSRTIRNFKIYKFNQEDGKVLFWIFSKGNKPYALPKFLPLRNDCYSLLEVFGAFNCEGAKYRKKNRHRDKLSFSNAELEQIKWFVDALKHLLHISEKEWKLSIAHSNIDKNKTVFLSHWKSSGVSEENISFVKNDRVSAPYGVGVLNIFNSTLSEVFYHIMEYCKGIACISRENAIDAFRGFSRGDMGTIENTITFDDQERDNLVLFKEVCNKLDITTGNIKFNIGKKGWWNIRITHRDNFKKILSFDGIRHQKRKEKIINDFLDNKKLSTYKYLKLVNDGFSDSASLSKQLNLSVITTRFYLSKLRREGYLNTVRIGKHNKIIHELTKGGKKELAFYEKLEQQIVK